ncbi:heme NO-binding domain-containing protein [Roseinatronobacter monicus]|uniref:heme NO-binding domain-containing protein n=1 Tax=Roseinatronobacter monicus TaxID=393481 RepID=UPI003F2B6216
MYGMIHQALRDMAIQHMGDAGWAALLQDAGLKQPLFIGMDYYSDETTMTLICLIAERLNMPLDTALHEFGGVWIDFAGASEYGRILQMAGDDFVTFLESLDRMHASIRSNMPKAEMPSFELIAADTEQMQLRYRSTRNGLAPFVQGILQAVAIRFQESVIISFHLEDGGAFFIIKRTLPHE